MSNACAPIREFVIGFGLMVFVLFACEKTFAYTQEETPEVIPVKSAELVEEASPQAATQDTPSADPGQLGEIVVLPQEETSEAAPVEEVELDEDASPTQEEMSSTPVESLNISEGAVVHEGSLEVPPPAAWVTDHIGTAANGNGIEKAELSDIVGDSIARDAVTGKAIAQDISLESTNEAIENRRTELAHSESEDDDAAGAAASGKGTFLSAKHIGWLWKFIWIALLIGFLLWLLSLMTAKAKKAKLAAAKPLSADDKSQRNSTNSNTVATDSDSTSADGNIGDIGSVFARRPEVVDDLTKIGGIDAAAEKRLNEAGIWQYDQLRSMNAQQRANLQRKLNLPRIRWYSLSGLSSASTNAEAGLDGSKNVRVDSGVAATSSGADAAGIVIPPPKFRDDLTRLPGIDAKAAAKLNEEGVYNFKQIESLSPTQKQDFEKRFGVDLGKLNVPQLASGTQASSVGAGQGTSKTVSGSTATVGGLGAAAAAGAAGIAGFAGGRQNNGSASTSAHQGSGGGKSSKSGAAKSSLQSSVTVSGTGDTKHSSLVHSDGPIGFVYTNKPSDADDLSKIDGIDAASAKRLNEAGIYKFEQLDQLDDQQKAAVAERCQLSGFNFTHCFPKIGRSDASLGFVYTEAPRDADDLTRLAGIDAAAAKRLNDTGIYKFDQLENLNEQQMGELATRFNLPEADPSDWKRCFYAWGRGINTSAEVDQVFENGFLNDVELPQFAEGVFDGEKLSAQDEQVIFRGSNPEGWGTGNTGIEGVETSLSCDDIRSDINYLRIRRTDTKESVVLPMTKGMIFSNGDPATSGWNGSSEVFFGGRHVGAFAEHLPQEVETKFSQGGWGFGHRYDHNDRQEWGWGGRVIEPTTMEVSVGCLGKTPGTLVFRGSDPSIWNTQSDGDKGFAIPISSVDHPVNFVRIMRQATGEAVIVRVDGNHVLDEGFDPRCGWNGSSAEFSGGIHLGVYHCDLPQDFETRFEFGGWGFGHPYDDNDRQAWGWAGRQLPETSFEISLMESVPAYMQHEVVS